MVYRKEKHILVDCDGVLMNWQYAFELWMDERGHKVIEEYRDLYDQHTRYGMTYPEMRFWIHAFNASAAIGFLPPLRDSVYYIRKLQIEHGFTFKCISALSKDKHAQELRTRNIKMLFGKNTFDEFIYQDTGGDKTDDLERFRDSGLFWLEDKPKNAELGKEMGLHSIMVAHEFNSEIEGIPRFYKWKDIYEYIIENQYN